MQEISLKNDVAIVTGGTRGIGAAIARQLANAEASVITCGRTVSEGTDVAKQIRNEGGEVVFKEVDVRNPDELAALVKVTVERFDGIDILVNNAAVETDTKPNEIDIETWTKIIETNLRAYWLTGKFSYPHLTESDRGAIVNVSSNHSFRTQPAKFPYNVTKSGIDSMTRAMAVAWGVDGIRANSVNPGWTNVERVANSLSEKESAHLERIHPLGRIASPKDVAQAVHYLVSDMSTFVTGETLTIDGGRTAVLQDDLYLADHGFES